MNFNLFHYSDEKIETLEKKEYPSSEENYFDKPRGLWVSVEREEKKPARWGWDDWCIAESFRLSHLSYKHQVFLKKETNILIISTVETLLDLQKKYPWSPPGWKPCKFGPPLADRPFNWALDWEKMKKEYQGIIISPYQWECRIHPDVGWYYGWDCESGCIWDLDAIDEFKFFSYKLYPKDEKEDYL